MEFKLKRLKIQNPFHLTLGKEMLLQRVFQQVEIFMTALQTLAEESGLHVKELDKKLERTILHSYRKGLMSQVSAETDPVSLLPRVISLLYIQVHKKALQAPGRAISAAVARLKQWCRSFAAKLQVHPSLNSDKLDDSAFKTLMDYHSATVAPLALISAATDDNFE